MFSFLKGKKKEEEKKENSDSEEKEKSEEVSKEGSDVKAKLTRLETELDKLKAGVEGLQEVRKIFTERFSRISEQIGELRSMIMERDRSMQEVELKALKAYELVDAVKPEKVMSEVQKEDAKVEALKANLEGNEAIMDRIMEELKEIKRKVEFFRGVEEIIKLSEEVKKELIEMKKLESKMNIDADKVETIYGEIRTRFKDLDAFSSDLEEMKASIEQNTKDIEFLKDKIVGLAEKSDVERVMNKVQRYIDALKELKKESSLTKDIEKIRTILESIRS